MIGEEEGAIYWWGDIVTAIHQTYLTWTIVQSEPNRPSLGKYFVEETEEIMRRFKY